MPVELVMPRLSDSMEEGTVLQWHVAEGDTVTRGQAIAEIETDKATMPYEADRDGVVLKILCAEGETAPLGAPIALIGEPGEAPPEGDGAGPAAARNGGDGAGPAAATPPPAAAPPPTPRARRVPASPLARRVAGALGVDLAALQGSGPGGRVVRADVEAAAAAPEPAPAAAPEPSGARGDVEVTPLTRVQQTIARRMAESRATVPAFELRADVDMGACVELRDRLRELGADPLPSYNDMVVKASALALREFPRVNGAYRDGAFEHFSRVNVGVAVAAEDALLVPTVADADRRSLGEIARATRELAAKVRDGSITPPELAGATFSVSNLGMFGVDSFSAVIDVPQAAILAVGALRTRPAVDEHGAIVARPQMTLTLACDHRILYGADGARFLARLRELLEEPLRLVL
jgi:pyruvate dehydrogenase E2 component (dihydrolipoamide acetyltransferase)